MHNSSMIHKFNNHLKNTSSSLKVITNTDQTNNKIIRSGTGGEVKIKIMMIMEMMML